MRPMSCAEGFWGGGPTPFVGNGKCVMSSLSRRVNGWVGEDVRGGGCSY